MKHEVFPIASETNENRQREILGHHELLNDENENLDNEKLSGAKTLCQCDSGTSEFGKGLFANVTLEPPNLAKDSLPM